MKLLRILSRMMISIFFLLPRTRHLVFFSWEEHSEKHFLAKIEEKTKYDIKDVIKWHFLFLFLSQSAGDFDSFVKFWHFQIWMIFLSFHGWISSFVLLFIFVCFHMFFKCMVCISLFVVGTWNFHIQKMYCKAYACTGLGSALLHNKKSIEHEWWRWRHV